MRLVTRADLDGLVCARILLDHETFDEIVLVHPQDITDRRVEIRPEDTLANLPYHPDCGRWFDHHLLTESNAKPPHDFVGLYREAPSAAELVGSISAARSATSRWSRRPTASTRPS